MPAIVTTSAIRTGDQPPHKTCSPGPSLICLLLLGAWVVPSMFAQELTPSELKYFKPFRTLTLDVPDSLLVAVIEHLDVDVSGRILVTDPRGELVLLFDSTGAFLASLDPRLCHPGFEFWPINAMFGGSEFIFLQNASPWGYRFTADGGCLGSVHREFTPPKFLDIDPSGTLYGLLDLFVWEVKRMDATGKTLSSFSIPEPRLPHASSRFGSGGLVADGMHIYYAWATEPALMKFTLDGTFVDRFEHRGSYFTRQRRDFPADVSPELMTALRNWGGTSVLSVFELTDQTIMVQYVDRKRGTGYQIFSKDGALVAEELGLDGWFFIHGGAGVVYGPVSGSPIDREGPYNPTMTIYRFVAP